MISSGEHFISETNSKQSQEGMGKEKLFVQRLLFQSDQTGTFLLKQDVDKIVDILASKKELLPFISEWFPFFSLSISVYIVSQKLI